MNAPSAVAVPQEERQPCHKCGDASEPCYSWHESSNGVKRVKRTCKRCGRSQGFAPSVEPYVTLANEAAAPNAALDVLLEAEDLGITLASNGKAVEIADDGWRRATPAFRKKLESCRHQLAKLLGKRTIS